MAFQYDNAEVWVMADRTIDAGSRMRIALNATTSSLSLQSSSATPNISAQNVTVASTGPVSGAATGGAVTGGTVAAAAAVAVATGGVAVAAGAVAVAAGAVTTNAEGKKKGSTSGPPAVDRVHVVQDGTFENIYRLHTSTPISANSSFPKPAT